MENSVIRAIVIILAAIGGLVMLGALAMGLGCAIGMCGQMMGGMGGMGGMMSGGIVSIVLAITLIAAIVALIVLLGRRK